MNNGPLSKDKQDYADYRKWWADSNALALVLLKESTSSDVGSFSSQFAAGTYVHKSITKDPPR